VKSEMTAAIRQHLIDPGICIRCNTCEAICPVGAVTHDANNYVVDVEKCNFCMDCVPPCPTGSINHFVTVAKPFSLQDQFSWADFPDGVLSAEAGNSSVQPTIDAVDEEIASLLEEAHQGARGRMCAPESASKPRVNLFSRNNSAEATVTGNFRLTATDATADIRHVILDFGMTSFPVLEGQSVGIIVPGTDARGQSHRMRLYSVASPRDGERPNTNNLALTVKRVFENRPKGVFRGLASNYICDLEQGAKVRVVGPFGSTFLMPDDPLADIVMICTGTGSAPFRGFTERRRRAMPHAKGKLYLFFGARSPQELPYFGPLKRVPKTLLDQELVFSRLPDKPKEYVQNRMLTRAVDLVSLLKRESTYIYVCGLRGMEAGVEAAFESICREHLISWESCRTNLRQEGRFHVETY
jgi:benzoyl-CoA 2,3-epoxidase subunit A